jgi:Uma2 family endonuclease
MSRDAAKSATWADIAGFPEGTRVEVLGGQIISAPSPGPRHQRIASGLTRFIGGPFDIDDDPGGWWILPEIDVEISPHDVVQPDLAGWRRARVATFPEDRPIRIVPDWICEILSPSNKRYDIVTKANLYLRFELPFYWTVDPEERVLQAFRWSGGSWLVLGAWSDGHKARIPPFDAVELDVTRLFPPKS